MTNFFVRARHPHWIGALRLSDEDSSVLHVGCNSKGRYILDNNTLTIEWDNYGKEIFIKNAKGVFVQDFILQVEITEKHAAATTRADASARQLGESGDCLLPTYLINLDRSTERLAEFEDHNGHLNGVIRFPAIDGRALDRDKLVEDGVIEREVPYSLGALGCALSHLALWEVAAASHYGITIAEDDAVFSRHYRKGVLEVFGKLPHDWDIILWGWNFNAFMWMDIFNGIPSTTKLIFDQDALRRHIIPFQGMDTCHVPLRLRHAFGTVCYSVSPWGAQKFMKHCSPIHGRHIEFPGLGIVTGNSGIDTTMNGIYPEIQAYVCMPPLEATEHRNETSTVDGGAGA